MSIAKEVASVARDLVAVLFVTVCLGACATTRTGNSFDKLARTRSEFVYQQVLATETVATTTKKNADGSVTTTVTKTTNMTPSAAEDQRLKTAIKGYEKVEVAKAKAKTFNPYYDPQGYMYGNRSLPPSAMYYGSYPSGGGGVRNGSGDIVFPGSPVSSGPDGVNRVSCNAPRCME